MEPLDVVVAHRNLRSAEALAASLNRHFRNVTVARSVEEMRTAIPHRRAQLAVVDLELVPMNEVQQLCHEFGGTSVVCTHRLPDEDMWTSALEAGAIDCCQDSDVRGILLAARRNVPLLRSTAA